MVFYDQEMMNQVLLEHHLADYLDFSINGEKAETVPHGLVDFLQVELAHQKVNFISNSLKQLHEAKKLGFKKFIIPEGNYKQIKDNDSSIKIRGVKSIQEAMQLVFS